MNTMIYYSFNVLILSGLILAVGMYKPKWILLWMDKPGRMPVVMIAAAVFMIGMILFGEGNKQLQKEKQSHSQVEVSVPAAAEVPVTNNTEVKTPAKP